MSETTNDVLEVALDMLDVSFPTKGAAYILEALDAAGFAVVPKEPTREMINAGQETPSDVGVITVYRAMIAASK